MPEFGGGPPAALDQPGLLVLGGFERNLRHRTGRATEEDVLDAVVVAALVAEPGLAS